MKIEQTFDKSMDSYGGLHFFHKFIDQSGLDHVFDQILGKRPAQAEYSYIDVFTSFAATCLAHTGPYRGRWNIHGGYEHTEKEE